MFSNISELEAWLNQVLANRDDYMSQAREALNVLEQITQINTLVRAILDDTALQQKIASRSYIHSNGFDKIVLIDSKEPEYKVRFHVWWPSESTTYIEDIHNHTWDFCSAILTGAFKFQIFQADDHGKVLYHYRKSLLAGGVESMDYMGQSKLHCTFDSWIPVGCNYTLERDVFHRVISVGNQVTSTILIQGPVVKNASDIFTDQPDHEAMPIRPFESSELRQKLQNYLALIE
jgi:hypothetical protein